MVVNLPTSTARGSSWTRIGRNEPASVRLSPKNTVCEYGLSLEAGVACANAACDTDALASARATAKAVRTGLIIGSSCNGWKRGGTQPARSEEHTSELQSLMRI